MAGLMAGLLSLCFVSGSSFPCQKHTDSSVPPFRLRFSTLCHTSNDDFQLLNSGLFFFLLVWLVCLFVFPFPLLVWFYFFVISLGLN